MATASTKVNVELPAMPELGARLFARLEPENQARMLSMIWDALRGEHGGAIGAADRCNQIKAESTFDREARNFLLNLLPRAEQPKTYTVEKTHDDGTVSTASGLTADEVLASYLNEDGGWPKRDRLPREHEDIEDRARNKFRDFATAYGMGAEKLMKALKPGDFARQYENGIAEPVRKGFAQKAVRHKVAEDEQQIIEKIGRELGPVVTVTVRSASVSTRPGVIVKLRPARPMNLNDQVQIDGLPVGTINKVNSDGTVEVLMRGCHTAGVELPNFRGQWNRATKTDTCPDCKGSGEYRGFTAVEPCDRCAGLGTL